MSNKNTINVYGIRFTGVLAIAFVVLKLIGIISWSWWWVLAPIYIPMLVAIIVLIIVIVFINKTVGK